MATSVYHNLLDDGLIEQLANGAVGVIPSDTIYGLACRASIAESVERLYALKSREHKPGTVIAATIEQLVTLGIPRRYLTAVEHLWPNSLSVIVPDSPTLLYLDQGLRCLAVRVPKDRNLSLFLEKTGPLVTTSANHPGLPPANNLNEAQAYFGDKVDFYVDGGDLSGRPPSTLIRIVDDVIEVLREGAVKIDDAGRVINNDTN